MKLDLLLEGKSVITSEKGNSMTPLIKSGQKHKLEPVKDIKDIKVGDIVYCKCKGKFFTHLVKALDINKGLLIGNNKGGINGWTKQVYGKVVEIYE